MSIFRKSIAEFRAAVSSLAGFSYDCIRFLRYSGWRGPRSCAERNYKAVKIYHRLEKSLAMTDRKAESGWPAADELICLLSGAKSNLEPTGFQESVGVKVLSIFSKNAVDACYRQKSVDNFLQSRQIDPMTPGGIIQLTPDVLNDARLENPERFFYARHSVRDFDERPVSIEDIMRAIRLAMSAPSACNRQAWHVYHMDKRKDIDKALSLQNGNRGFGHKIHCLLILAADLAAFDSGAERYQHWIDGGMFSMNLVLALHSIGIASCCLNWSKGPRGDIAMRKILPIQPRHSIIMMLGVGYVNKNITVCASPRRPISEIYTYLS